MRVYELVAFGEERKPSISIKAGLSIVKDRLNFEFSLFPMDGDIFWPDRLKILQRGERLYTSTCFEIFISNGIEYIEYNFSPSREWSAYGFQKYRVSSSDFDMLDYEPAEFDVEKTISGSTLTGSLNMIHILKYLDPASSQKDLKIGLSAVVKYKGNLSYWALKHFGKKPDFHRQESFMVPLPIFPV